MAKFYGPNFPFYDSGRAGLVAARQEDNRLIKNDFLQGIMTLRGERWFRPNFGGDVRAFVFDPNDDTSKDQLEESIRRQTTIFHPRVQLTKVDVVDIINNPNAVEVRIFGRTDLDAANAESLLVQFQVPVAGTLG